jgi:putative membrane protein
MMRRMISAAAVLGALVAALGCSNNHEDSASPYRNATQESQAPDKDFMMKTAYANLGEVDLGRLAQKKAFDPEVGKFGEHMVEDHTAVNKKLSSLAAKKGVALPVSTDDTHRNLYAKLNDLTGVEFDRKYIAAMIDGHEKVISMFEENAKSAHDADVRDFAKDTLPGLQKHLKMARDLKSKPTGQLH